MYVYCVSLIFYAHLPLATHIIFMFICICCSIFLMLFLNKILYVIFSLNKKRRSPKQPNTPISRSRHFEIESEAPVGRNPEVKLNNNDLDYQSRAATAI